MDFRGALAGKGRRMRNGRGTGSRDTYGGGRLDGSSRDVNNRICDGLPLSPTGVVLLSSPYDGRSYKGTL